MDRVLCWNVRGLNRQAKQAEVRRMILTHQIKLFSLLETRLKAANMRALYLNVCPNWCLTTNLSSHMNGRIVVAWDHVFYDIDILVVSSQLVIAMSLIKVQ